jgi:hypothetical protein
VDLTWINPSETDSEGDTRTFSIASAPDDPQLLFATRLRDTAFKRILERAPLGAALRMERPLRKSDVTQQREPAGDLDCRRHRDHALSQYGPPGSA